MILASYHPLAGSRSIVRLASHGGKYFHVVLTNPPFGKKSSVAYVNEEGGQERDALTILRDDFWASTSSKQVNFVQHVRPILEIHGRAAVVVPDNLPDPDFIAAEVADDLRAALEQIAEIQGDLTGAGREGRGLLRSARRLLRRLSTCFAARPPPGPRSSGWSPRSRRRFSSRSGSSSPG